GLLVPPRNSAALAHAISALLNDRQLATHLGQAGQRRIARDFQLEHSVRETENLYVELLERARERGARDGAPRRGAAGAHRTAEEACRKLSPSRPRPSPPLPAHPQ